MDLEFEKLISRRASTDNGTTADDREELWKSSVRRHNARLEEENRAAWAEFHQAQAARLRAAFEPLIARHEEQARKLSGGAA